VPDFGRVFLMLKYTDMTQNTYVHTHTHTHTHRQQYCGYYIYIYIYTHTYTHTHTHKEKERDKITGVNHCRFRRNKSSTVFFLLGDSPASESPKRKNTTFRTRRTFEIKNKSITESAIFRYLRKMGIQYASISDVYRPRAPPI
jgi:hypothetical protein